MKDIQVGNEYFVQNSSYGKLWGIQMVDNGAAHCDIVFNRYSAAGVLLDRPIVLSGTGSVRLAGVAPNFSTASQSGFATDTYVTGSSVAIPTGDGLSAGTRYRCTFSVTKTAAGTAAAVFTVRIGTAGAVGDTSRLAMTADVAQTAAVDSGIVTVEVLVRSQSATGVIAGGVGIGNGSGAGLGSGATAVSSAFDNTYATLTPASFIGLSVNGGASAAWTINHVFTELLPA